MAFRFLKALLSGAGQAQSAAIESLVRKEDEDVLSVISKEFEEDVSRMTAALQGAAQNTSPYRAQEPVIPEGQTVAVSSKLLNTNFRMMYLALHGIFRQLILTDATIRAHKKILDSRLNSVTAGLNKITQDLEMHAALRNPDNQYNGYNQIFRFDFWNSRNETSGRPPAEVDVNGKKLRLPAARRSRVTRARGSNRSLVTTTNLSYTTHRGILSKDFKPLNAIDESDQTFWMDMTLADSTIDTSVDFKNYDNSSTTSTNYNGVLVQYRVDFGGARNISRLQALPFAQFPVQLVGIEYLNGVDGTGTEDWRLVKNWAIPSSGDHSTASLNWIEHQFVPVTTSAIRLTLLQPNYTKNTYLVPKLQVDNSTLWSQMLDEDLQLVASESDLTGLHRKEIQSNPRYRSLIDANKQLFEDLSSVLINTSDQEGLSNIRRQADLVASHLAKLDPESALPVLRAFGGHSEKEFTNPAVEMVSSTKLEYQIGLLSLNIFDEVFFPDATWSSPKYATHSRIYGAAIESTTDIPQMPGVPGGTVADVGSVEYELEFAPDRRKNILLEGTTSVTEVLKFGPSSKTAKLRFNPDSVEAVHKNGLLVDSGDYTVNTGAWTIALDSGVDLELNARYTATYTPASGQDSINVDTLWNSKSIIERFNNTSDNNGRLTLKYEPYIAREIVNNSTDWYRTEEEYALYHYRAAAGSVSIDGITYASAGNVTYEPIVVLINGVKARNLTRYSIEEGETMRPDGTIDQPAFSDTGQQDLYQFIQQGSTLYLNRPTTAGSSVEVSYRWLTQYAQVHCTLRSHRVLGKISPALQDVTLKMNTSNVFSRK